MWKNTENCPGDTKPALKAHAIFVLVMREIVEEVVSTASNFGLVSLPIKKSG